jgi:hypothetical protein
MASTRDIRRRIKSVKNTRQITKAMELVAASKMKKAQQAALAGRPYAELMADMLAALADRVEEGQHPFLVRREVRTRGIILVTSDKGLCGPLNANLFKLVVDIKTPAKFAAIGRKGAQFLVRTKRDLLADFQVHDRVPFNEVRLVAEFMTKQYLEEVVDTVEIIWPRFRNTLIQVPEGLKRGNEVKDTGAPISVPVGEGVLGRIFNVLGDRPTSAARSPSPSAIPSIAPPRRCSTRTPRRRGARDRHQGHRPDLSLHQGRQGRRVRRRGRRQDRRHHGADQQHRQGHGGYSVFAGVGERTREGNDLYHEMSESGVIDQKDLSKSKVALVYGQMNEPPGARMRVALSALAMAEYFRDEKNQDVLLFIDNIFRFSQAGSEVSALLGRTPSAVGYQPTLAAEMGQLQERITSTKNGSITSFQAVYVPRTILTDPGAGQHLRAPRLDHRARALHRGTRHLSRRRSPRLDLQGAHARHRRRGALRGRPRRAESAAALQGSAGHHQHPRHGRALRRRQAARLSRAQNPALPQPALHVAEVFTGTPGVRSRSRTPSRASRKSSTASTTTWARRLLHEGRD